MSAPGKSSKSSQPHSRPWGVYIALLVGFITLSTITWFGTQRYANNVAELNTKALAQSWIRQVISEFSDKKNVFTTRNLRINDKYTLKDYQKGTTVFRFRLLGDDGRVFWSSKFDENGMIDKRSIFTDQVKRGESVINSLEMKASEIERLSVTSNSSRLLDKKGNPIPHHVAEVLLPVIDSGKFVGAVSLLFDNTEIYQRSKTMAYQIAQFGITAFALVFSIISIMIWGYGTLRNKQNQALRRSKQKAVDAEKEAREMAVELQKVNDDVGQLNAELSKNMKVIRDTQNEVIRKGKLAQLGQLTATVAHDIRNPLGSVRTSTFLLRRKFAADNPTMEKPLTRIENGVERCDSIITQLLDFARSKDISLKTRNFDEWLVGLVREQSEQLPTELSFECTLGLADRPYAFDADNLARAVINFLSNASEAMVGKGNDKPQNPTINPTIRLKTALTDRGVEISVTDNGPGISADNLEKILDPLFTTKSYGVGLGLPAVEKIFEQHGGGMEIQSEPGNGATFTGWILAKSTDDDTFEQSNAA